MLMCAGLLQVNGLLERTQKNILSRFCSLWQDRAVIDSNGQKSQKKPSKDENWSQLEQRCVTVDVVFYNALEEMTKLRREVTDHENEYGCTDATRKWRHFFADHGLAILVYEREIKAAEKARQKSEGLERYAKRMVNRDRKLQEQGKEERKQ